MYIFKQEHNPYLDLYRGLCGYGIAISHFYLFNYDFLISKVFSMLFVEGFFVLSGYVLCNQIELINYNQNLIKTFLIRRWMRTIPLFLIALIIFSIVFNSESNDFFKYLFLIQDFKINFLNQEYFYILWSLSIEEYFYLLFPLVLYFLKDITFTYKVYLFIILIYFLKFLSTFYQLSFEDLRTLTFLRLDSIAFGVLLHIHKDLLLKKLGLVFITSIFSIFFIFSETDFANTSELRSLTYIFVMQILSMTSLFIFEFIYSLRKNINERLIIFFKIIANQTYSIYLFHLIFIYVVQEMSFLDSNKIGIVFYLILISFFSFVIYHTFEKNILKHRPSYK